MREEELKEFKLLSKAGQASINHGTEEKAGQKAGESTALKPSNQLEGGLLGWYAACSSNSIKSNQTHHFSMYNEQLILYRNKDNNKIRIK